MVEAEWFARLTLKDFPSMPKKKRDFMVKWLRALATELNKSDPKEYNKNFRATLFK